MYQGLLRKLAFFVIVGTSFPASIFGQSQFAAASSPNAKTTEDVYKNIKVLKGIPADQLIPAMQFITYGLGVECSYCHVEGALEKDDKKTKETARKMIEMMRAVNHDNFEGKPFVTCYSCHRGSPHPVGIPLIPEAGIPQVSAGEKPEENPEANLPSPDQILSKYVEAIGGSSVVSKIHSRVLKGTVTLAGHSLSMEIVSKAPDEQLTIIHLPNGDNLTAYNGHTGWTSGPNRPAHEIPAVEVASARVETDITLPLDLRQLFSELKSTKPEKVGDRETYVLSGFNSGEIAAKFYFDEDSRLLVRILRYTKSPLGLYPTQIDYADYRMQDGVKVPFQQTISRPNSRLVIQIEDVKFNVSVDNAKFAPPPAQVPANQPQ